jgi:ribosomal protein S18 acetylase RimI-like enzyme
MMTHTSTIPTTGLEPAISIRPVRRGDELLVQEIVDGMSPESRYHRFLQAMPRLSPGMRRLLADVDGVRHRAWAAYLGDRAVGVVRLVADQHGDHELSIAVIDAMHRRGVGRELIGVALAAADEAGIESVSIMVHPENAASITMFRRLGATFRFEFGLLVGRVPVRRPAPASVVAA